MRIGVDIDGVLTNLSSFMFDYSIDYFKERGKELINPKGDELLKMYDITEKDVFDFWNEFLIKYFNMPPKERSSEIITRLQKEGNEIYIITSRSSVTYEDALGLEKTKDITIDWLTRYGINPNKIIFTSNNKLDVCKENDIDILIDDMERNILPVSKEIKCICFNAIYNEDIKGENIIRCYSWPDIYNKIHKISKLC